MRVALISFEFPPAVAIGGIGTYAWQASLMMAQAGWEVVVFAAGEKGEEPAEAFGVKVHRVKAANRKEFRQTVVATFEPVHLEKPFDVIESPEIGAEGAEISRRFTDLPVVVKLHTPTYLVSEVGGDPYTWIEKARFTVGALIRGRWAKLESPAYSPDTDLECAFAKSADDIASPSLAIGQRLTKDWTLADERVSYFPYPFDPPKELLDLNIPSSFQTIGFVGRLEARKGVAELARAIPAILKRAPHLQFRFIGPTWPFRRTDMETWIRKICKQHLHQIHFTGPVDRADLHRELDRCDIVVLPSRWESFGLVCPEAMAAGRAVIGSASGGMADIVEPDESGLLVPPRDPAAIARAVLTLTSDPVLARRLAIAGRARILELLRPSQVLSKQEHSYRRAIAHRKLRNSCPA